MIALAVGLSLAFAPAPVVSSMRAAVDTVRDTVYVVSNRRRTTRGFTRAVSDSLWFGLYITRLVASPGPGRALAPMHVRRIDSLALAEPEWRARLAAAVTDSSARRAALLYVHGYSSSPGTAVAQGVQVKARGGHDGPLVVFLWPTHDRYVAPPTPARAYHDDAKAAAASGPALAHVVLAVDSISPGTVLVAHSMGSRIALAALTSDGPARDWVMAHPLRAIGLFSPDVDADTFRDALAPRLASLSPRVTMYGTSSDYLLGAARLVNGEPRAAGIAVRGPSVAGVELVNATRGARAEPALLTLLGPRHSVRWASAALADFFGIVVSGAAPECRGTLESADQDTVGRWTLRRRAPLPGWLGANCALSTTAAP